jgi:hypothetical protein
MAPNGDSKYPVGYKKPPRHSQFKPGLSGNVKGRPKGSKNFTTVFEEELRAPIEVTENGKRKRISKRQAIVKQTVNRAASGDPKATSILLTEASGSGKRKRTLPVPSPFQARRVKTIPCRHLSPMKGNSDVAHHAVGRGISIHPATRLHELY